MRKKVLIVGMLDSIHLARWISQFKDSDVEISIFPSRRFRNIHPQLRELIDHKFVALENSAPKLLGTFLGYIDFILFETSLKKLFKRSRVDRLRKVLTQQKFDFVHLIEFQHAGYLYLDLEIQDSREWITILTNLGSDIFYFAQFPNHELRIRALLSKVDAYSAECYRDYKLAKEFGFEGIELPLVPNAGGFGTDLFETPRIPSNQRSEMFLKGYGGEFGLPDQLLKTCEKILSDYPNMKLNIVSVTPDVLSRIKALQNAHPGKVKYWTITKPISHQQILTLLGRSLIYFGFSKSDGISTTFLEALIMGAYPIQTDTSCVNEWIAKGFAASTVTPYTKEIFVEVDRIMSNRKLATEASEKNVSLAKVLLDERYIRESSISYYK